MCSRRLRSCETAAAPIRSITTTRSRPGRSSPTAAYSMSRSRSQHTVIAREAEQSTGRKQGLDCFVASLLAMTLLTGWLAPSSALAAEPGHFCYGKPATPAEIAGWDIDVRGDDGAGLRAGQGSVVRGGQVYGEQCAACHGTFGEGEGRFPKLAGGTGTLTHDRPELTVGSYWPFAPTLWDYINRAMPMPAPHALSADDVYALTAYILHLNDIVPGDFIADRNS